MGYQYNGFIPQNIAPEGVTRIGVYDKNGKRMFGIPLGRLARPQGEKLYNFGLLSDLHLSGNSVNGTRLDNALTFFEEQGCAFCAHTGDMTNIGFWYPISEAEGTSYYNPVQFDEYKSVCEKHSIPVYGCCGNHESYNGYKVTGTYTDTYGADPTLVVNTLQKMKEYTGHPLHYAITHGADVFIFIGQPEGSKPMTDDALEWLGDTLEENRDKRCFIFVHPFVSDADSGNPYGVYTNKIFDWWGAKTTTFIDLLRHYKNTILFHGHSHFVFEMQEEVENATYSEALGFRSVHVPSLASNRKVVDGKLVSVGGSYGYLVDVYEDRIVLNGVDFGTGEYVPLAVYSLDITGKGEGTEQ
ncbi:MAG: hypothetical protein E7553_06665 [Ruminococcaceae bacterium]|nr:hypothetical protein [Oscillospiraceae bacterium]